MKSPRSLAALLLLVSACAAGAPFQRGKPVEVVSGGLGNTYMQDGKPFNLKELLDDLSANDATREEAGKAQSLMSTAGVLAAVGGAGMGWGAVSGIKGEKSGWAILGGGAVVTAIAFGVGAAADGHLSAAVGTYNERLGGAPKTSLLPWIAPTVAAAGEARGVQAGIYLRF